MITRERYLLPALFAAPLLLGTFLGLANSTNLNSSAGLVEVSATTSQASGPQAALPGQEQILTEKEFREFLRNAKVTGSRQTSKGITAPFKLTLSDGQRTLEACFQAVDVSKSVERLATGTEIGFRDSYKFNIAAYELARLLGLDDMIPVTVPYTWKGQTGSLCWWVPAKLDEQERLKQKLQPPDVNAWNKQMNRMWVFSELVYDTDRNQTNILIMEDWKIWIIDFTRAFRLRRDLQDPSRLVMCDRQLLERLRELNEAEVLQKTKPYLSKSQVRALMTRRDRIVAYFEQLITQKGEDRVLY